MGRSCRVDEHWDDLIRKCLHCQMRCRQPNVIPRCISYCESAKCKAVPGHYYDVLLKNCVRCTDVCGAHPTECSLHCQTPPSPVTSYVPYSRVPWAPKDPTILLYSLLALCMVMLFFSLSLALVVFLRGARAKSSNPGPKEANHCQDCVVQLSHEVGQPRCQPGQSSKDFVTNSSRPTDREPSDDSSPTETCVCVHCFPDLKVLGQGNDRQLRASLPFYPQALPQSSQIQNGGPHRIENFCKPGWEVQEEAAVG